MAKEIRLAGMHFTKIAGEKNPDFKDKLQIKPNISIKDIEKFKKDKTEAAKVKFSFSVKYSDLGSIDLEGTMFLTMDSKTLKETLSGWKDKKLDNETNLIILNVIMQKASLKALALEDELGLPPHVSLPKLQIGKESK